jgi:nucleotide-binding universal stress UspA family protein
VDRLRRLLVPVDASSESRDALRAACDLARACEASLTVLAVAVLEAERRGCCDTRTPLWNRMQREVAAEDLAAARSQVEAGDVEFVAAAGEDLAAVVEQEAQARACDAIVVPATRRRLGRKNQIEAILRAGTSLRVITSREVADLIGSELPQPS